MQVKKYEPKEKRIDSIYVFLLELNYNLNNQIERK